MLSANVMHHNACFENVRRGVRIAQQPCGVITQNWTHTYTQLLQPRARSVRYSVAKCKCLDFINMNVMSGKQGHLIYLHFPSQEIKTSRCFFSQIEWSLPFDLNTDKRLRAQQILKFDFIEALKSLETPTLFRFKLLYSIFGVMDTFYIKKEHNTKWYFQHVHT